MERPAARLFRTIRLLWTFYKNFVFLSTLISVCCLVLFLEYGFSVFIDLFWLKVITSLIIFYFVDYYKRQEYYYYFNLGISKTRLWSPIFIFDFSLFILMITLAHLFK
ncbi:MAG TPA: hypothetical protein VFC34_04015 [Puia sp.]|nr:hypothetical protein [Puia sp.]